MNLDLKTLRDIQRRLTQIQHALSPPPPKEELPPVSNSYYWKPKGEKQQEDAPWIKDGGWSGKR